METIYAALLLHKLGKDINEESLNKVVAAAGGKVEEAQIKSLLASLKGVDIAKELETASLAVAVAPAGANAAPTEGGAEKKEEAKPKEEKKEAAAEGLSALFG